MNISRWKVVWSFVTGGGAGVVDYVLGLLRQALDGIGTPTREKIQAVLNFSLKALAVVQAFRIFIPVKWQTAYALTVAAIETVIRSLEDFNLEKDELTGIIDAYKSAQGAWLSPDDETCVDCTDVALAA